MRGEKRDSSCVVLGPSVLARVQLGMSGNFFNCLKGVKDPFKAQEGRWDFSRDAAGEKGLISR